MRFKTMPLYLVAARRMLGRSRPDRKLRSGCEILVLLSLFTCLFIGAAHHQHGAMTVCYWMFALFSAGVTIYGWAYVIHELFQELNSIARLIGARK